MVPETLDSTNAEVDASMLDELLAYIEPAVNSHFDTNLVETYDEVYHISCRSKQIKFKGDLEKRLRMRNDLTKIFIWLN